jgi:hypothetical protein
VNLHGRAIGSWSVVSYAGGSKWACVCACGTAKLVGTRELANGHTKSCGCRRHAVKPFDARSRSIPSGDCLLWTGAIDRKGYGNVGWNGRSWKAHRLAYFTATGDDRPGVPLLHSCDTPRCINPSHLRYGTAKDNQSDSVARGRNTRGSMSHHAKMSEADVAEAIRMRRSGATVTSLARRFGLSVSGMSMALSGRKWKHVHATLESQYG